MRYDEAIEALQSKGVEVEWGQDLDYLKEKILTSDFEVPHFLTHYPRVAKPFYHCPDEDPKYVLCHDLLAPEGYGEIIGGGRGHGPRRKYSRELTRREPLVSRTNSTSISGDMEESPTEAFGLGVDRLCTWLSALSTSERPSRSQGIAEGSLHRKW